MIGERSRGRRAFAILFWIHNIVFGGSSALIAIELLSTGKATGVINAIALALIWIGGSITWGFAALIHERPSFNGRIEPESPAVRS